MTTTVIYAVLPNLSYFDTDKLPLTNGTIYFYDEDTRDPKVVYLDAAGTVDIDHINFDAAGRLPAIYFAVDNPYYIEAFNQLGGRAWTLENWTPPTSGSTPVTTVEDYDNLVINGQFRYFQQAQYLTVPTTLTKIAEDAFYFRKDGTGATDRIDFTKFGADETAPDATPIYFFDYTCTVAGAGETYKDLVYIIKDVRTLANIGASLSLGCKLFSGSSGILSLYTEQYFGTGGSASSTVQTHIGSVTATSSWQDFPVNFTVHNITGKTIGTNNDDELRIFVRIPTSITCRIGITNFYFKRGNAVANYPYQTYAQTTSEIQALEIPRGTRNDNGKYINYQTPAYNTGGSYLFSDAPPIGSMLYWLTATAPTGWLLTNGQALSRAGLYKRLYSGESGSIGYNFTSKSGFSLKTDDVDKVIFEADVIGVHLAAPGAGTSGFTVTLTTTGDATHREKVTVTFVAAHSITTGQYFLLSTPNRSYLIYYIKDAEYLSDIPYLAGYTSVECRVITGDTITNVRDKTYAILNQLPPEGILSQENFLATAATATVTTLSLRRGAVVSPPNAGTTPFTVTVVTPGSDTAYEEFTILCTAASTLTPSMYFTVATQTKQFAFYFIIDGIGEEPVAAYDYKVPVEILSSDSANTNATTIATLLNYILFQIPYTEGMFIRSVGSSDTNKTWAYDPGTRIPGAGGITTGAGTLERDEFKSHYHGLLGGTSGGGARIPPVAGNASIAPTIVNGGTETRGKNFASYVIIKAY